MPHNVEPPLWEFGPTPIPTESPTTDMTLRNTTFTSQHRDGPMDLGNRTEIPASQTQDPKVEDSCLAGLMNGTRLSCQQLVVQQQQKKENEEQLLGYLGRLPYEIRVMIYRELWKHTPCIAGNRETNAVKKLRRCKVRKGKVLPSQAVTLDRINYFNFNIIYDGDMVDTNGRPFVYPRHQHAQGLPRWLLACRTILKEGMAELYFRSDYYMPFTHTSLLMHWEPHNSDAKHCLTGLSRATRVTTGFPGMDIEYVGRDPGGANSSFWKLICGKPGTEKHMTMVKSLLSSSGPIRDLRLGCNVFLHRPYTITEPCQGRFKTITSGFDGNPIVPILDISDLGWIRGLKSLQSVSIMLQFSREPGFPFSSAGHFIELLSTELKEQLRKLAGELWGNEVGEEMAVKRYRQVAPNLPFFVVHTVVNKGDRVPWNVDIDQ